MASLNRLPGEGRKRAGGRRDPVIVTQALLIRDSRAPPGQVRFGAAARTHMPLSGGPHGEMLSAIAGLGACATPSADGRGPLRAARAAEFDRSCPLRRVVRVHHRAASDVNKLRLATNGFMPDPPSSRTCLGTGEPGVRGLLLPVVAVLTTAGLTACSVSPAAVHSAAAPAATSPAATSAPAAPSAAPSPVSTQATVTGKCAAGVDDLSTGMFYSMASMLQGSGPGSEDEIAEAYQLTLTDNSSSATAEVTGFAVVFYSQGQELTSDAQQLPSPTFITPGQSLTWTEYPWGTSTSGQGASVGPFAAGVAGAVDSAATCQLLQWYDQ
jgi:hypothetical protein